MTAKKKLTITVDMDEIIIIKNTAASIRAWCSACERETLLISMAQATPALGLTARSIRQRIESGEAHCLTDRDGMLICLNSLLR